MRKIRASWTPKQRDVLIPLRKAAREKRLNQLTKVCGKCGLEKTLSNFPIKGKTADGRDKYGYCKPCHVTYQRILTLKRQFNLTPEDKVIIESFQGNVCAICKRTPTKTKLAVDHSHKDGLIRGCLCWICNKALGILHDNPDTLKSMLIYLENPPAIKALGAPRYGNPGRTSNKAATIKLLKKQLLIQQKWEKEQRALETL